MGIGVKRNLNQIVIDIDTNDASFSTTSSNFGTITDVVWKLTTQTGDRIIIDNDPLLSNGVGRITVNGNLENTAQLRCAGQFFSGGNVFIAADGGVTGGGPIAAIGRNADRFFIAPSNFAGDFNFSKEITLSNNGTGKWLIEGGLITNDTLEVTFGGANITGNVDIDGDVSMSSGPQVSNGGPRSIITTIDDSDPSTAFIEFDYNPPTATDVTFLRFDNNRFFPSGESVIFETRNWSVGGNIRTSSYTVGRNGGVTIGAARQNDQERDVLFVSYAIIGPAIDNTITGGTAAERYSELFSANGVINTSDQREKQDFRNLNDQEKQVAIELSKLPQIYRWKKSIEEKGNDARYHIGCVAQEVEQIFSSHGLDAGRYGVLCYDEWEDGDRFGIRYDQLSQWQAAGFDARLKSLEETR